MKLPVNKTTPEQRLIRKGWKNRPYSKCEEDNRAFPRGVWFSPAGTGPHTLTVAVLLTTTPEPTGEPFADSADLAAMRKAERAEAVETRRAERQAIADDRAQRTAERKAERALW